jgi:hypothetical protein
MEGKTPTVLSQPPRDEHIAACSLFCSGCGRFQSGKCEGCQIRPGFAQCRVRGCCADRKITGCHECPEFAAPRDYRECGKVNHWIPRLISLFTKSDWPRYLTILRDEGKGPYLAAKRARGRN